jgi:hypothetical protein
MLRNQMKTPGGNLASGEAAISSAIDKRQSATHGTVRTRIKSAIVRAALAGLINYAVADWLIQHGGFSHD